MAALVDDCLKRRFKPKNTTPHESTMAFKAGSRGYLETLKAEHAARISPLAGLERVRPALPPGPNVTALPDEIPGDSSIDEM
jgi:hypothetical protein